METDPIGAKRLALSRLGEQLTQWRALRGIGAGELARRSDVSLASIRRMEKGAANPSIGTVAKVADALGCDVSVQFVARADAGASPR